MTSLVQPQEPMGKLKERYDGRAKVTGKAQYAADFPASGTVHAFIVQSTIPNGTVTAIDQTATEFSYGVLAVITPFNAPRLPVLPAQAPRRAISTLQNPDIHYNGQPIAVVVAKSLDQARHAATLLKISYQIRPSKLDFMSRLGEARAIRLPGRDPVDSKSGDLEASMAKASAIVDETYTTPLQNHNSMETHSTLAWWEGEMLNLYDSTQSIARGQQTVASVLGISTDNVRVQCPYTGGGFGSKGSTWSHVILAAMAAKVVGKPVKLALDRRQMFGPVGSRPATVQKIRLGASHSGKLVGVQHDVILSTSVMEDFLEASAAGSRMLYSSDSIVTSHRLVEMNIGVATEMRGPGEASGMAAFESAMDELAIKLNMDPVELRLINYAERDESRKLPFSAKHLRECYTQASERFGWSGRTPAPGQRLEGNELIGFGMASATRHALRSAAQATVRILPNGRAFVASGTQDLGTGTYTLMADTAAEVLGLDPSLIDVVLGDSALPPAPPSVGSQTAASVCPAVHDAATKARAQLLRLAMEDPQSPLHGLDSASLDFRNGRVFAKASPSDGEAVEGLIARNGGKPIEVTASSEPGAERNKFSSNSFGAVFAEVAVDRDTFMVKVRRIVATYDIGSLLNPTTGINQLVGGIVWGISFALHEEARIDAVYGRTVNQNFADYHVPVNADIGTIDVTVLDIPDTTFNQLGARGIGEVSVTGVAAAIANAIYNATGRRVRDFPITPEKIMQAKRTTV